MPNASSPFQPLPPEYLDRLGRLLIATAGIELPPQRLRELERAVRDRMSARGVGLEAYIALVDRERAEAEGLAELTTVGETYFFRHWDDFVALRDRLLPPLLARENRGGRPPALWSAACSSGEEPYSMAMVLASLSPTSRGRVLGTDLSMARLEKGRAAVYGEWSFRSVGAELVLGNFEAAAAGQRRVAARLRPLVELVRYNLCSGQLPPGVLPGSIDVIFLRNVLMYLQADAVRQLIRRLFDALAPGGSLVVSSAEAQLDAFAQFDWSTGQSLALFVKPDGTRAPRVAELRSSPSAEPTAEPPDLLLPQLLLGRARAERARGGVDHLRRAARLASAAAVRSPFELAAPLVGALALLDAGDPAAALPLARRAANLGPAEPMACLALAYALRGTGNEREAVVALRNAREAAAGLPPGASVTEGDGLSPQVLLSALADEPDGLGRSPFNRAGPTGRGSR